MSLAHRPADSSVEYLRLALGFDGRTSLRAIDREVVDGVVVRQVATTWGEARSPASRWLNPADLAQVPDGTWMAIPPDDFASAWASAMAELPSGRVWRVLSRDELLAARDTGWTGFGRAHAPGRVGASRAAVLDGAGGRPGPWFLATAAVVKAYLEQVFAAGATARTLPPDEIAVLDLFVVGPVVVVEQLPAEPLLTDGDRPS